MVQALKGTFDEMSLLGGGMPPGLVNSYTSSPENICQSEGHEARVAFSDV